MAQPAKPALRIVLAAPLVRQRASVCERAGAARSTAHLTRRIQLCRGRIHRRAEDGFLEGIGSLAGDFGELAHPERSEWEQDVGQSVHVSKESISVLLDESSVALERLDARPLVLRGHTRLIRKRGA